MTFREFWDNLTPEAKRAFAKACGFSLGHLRNVAKGYKKATPETAYAIERASSGIVSKRELCPAFRW